MWGSLDPASSVGEGGWSDFPLPFLFLNHKPKTASKSIKKPENRRPVPHRKNLNFASHFLPKIFSCFFGYNYAMECKLVPNIFIQLNSIYLVLLKITQPLQSKFMSNHHVNRMIVRKTNFMMLIVIYHIDCYLQY